MNQQLLSEFTMEEVSQALLQMAGPQQSSRTIWILSRFLSVKLGNCLARGMHCGASFF
jgi:hypothetical protein